MKEKAQYAVGLKDSRAIGFYFHEGKMIDIKINNR